MELQAQRDINLIISVDDNIIDGSLSRLRLIASLENGAEQTVEVNYYPGNLSLRQADYDKLLDTSVKTVFLAFDYTERCKSKEYTKNYKIDLQKGWLKHYYYILHIYNTDKRQYKKIYTPLEGKSYTYEYDYPGGSVKRIRKKGKQDCE
jgi:hypothetical protein